ncbi:hypothetical protein AB0C76_05140 [Kitasatospora sp. NPDC048722]|uniref:hypothetical protein n=1 Tax=Kitasatospora sp. NPDC048722 TaxID=3155639 RepID=UPI0033EEC574
MQEVWFADVLRHLRVLLAALPPLIEEYRERRIAGGIEGLLEWTLPWGMDDGVGNVRLTVVEVPSGWGERKRVRVVVAADAKAFHERKGSDDLPLPRYDEKARRPLWFPRSASLSRDMAEYLLDHADGDAGSLRAEAGNAASFTVVIMAAETG